MHKLRAKTFKALITVILAGSLVHGMIIESSIPSYAATTIKIMPVGDSCTEGMGDPDMGSYRAELYNLYKNAGLNFDFVGSNKRGPDSLPDKDNEGHSGWTIPLVANSINNWLNTHNPDVVLLWIGGNDLLQTGQTNPTGLSNLIDQIFSVKPNIVVFVSDYYPVPDSVTKYNSEIPGVVQKKFNEGKKVYLNKMSSMNFVRSTDLSSDGLHLNKNGYVKAAQIWYDTTISILKSMSEGTSSPSPTPTSTPVISPSQQQFTKLGDVNSDGYVNSTDYSLLKRYILGIVDEKSINFKNADLNTDGRVNSTDYSTLKKVLLGIIVPASPSPSSSPDPSPGSKKFLIPHSSWTCGMPSGIPTPEDGVLVMEVNMNIEKAYDLGKTQYGNRKVYVISGGTVSGSKINASVMSGGLDFQLNLSNGAMEVEQIFVLRSGDGNYIYMRTAGTAANENDLRIVPDIEAPNSGSYNWLNSGKYVARRSVDLSAKTMKLSIYDVSAVSGSPDSSNSVAVTKPQDVQYQSWDYRIASSEKRGSEFINEYVTLGSSQSIGSTKNGRNRNIIPITGGTVTGTLNAKILYAGADYQNISNPMTIDARYLWETNDGEIIIVRNGGQFGSLVPTFEVNENSKYSYLNRNLYLSSDPAMSGGGVNITFYNSTK